MYRAKITLIPIVIIWNDFVTKYFKKRIEEINMNKFIQAYI